MGKLSRYDGGDLPEDRQRKKRPSSAPRPGTTSNSNSKRVKKTEEKKPKSLTVRIRDVRRLMMKFKDEENQKKLQERLDVLLQKQMFKHERVSEMEETKLRIERSRKARLIELKKLERKLKSADDDEVRDLIENDIEYIKTYPKGKEYLPLFDTKLSEQAKGERDELRKAAALRRMQGKGDEGNTMGEDADDADDFFAEADEEDDEE